MSNSNDDGINKELENECLTIEKLQIDSETDSSLDDSIEEDKASVASTSQAVEVAVPDEKLKKQNKNVKNKTKSKGKLKRNNQADGPHEYKLFVTKLTKEVTSENIKDYFERYGTVTNVTLMNQSAICAFVTFSKFKALKELFTRAHVLSGNSVEIHPNIHLRDECRRWIKQNN